MIELATRDATETQTAAAALARVCRAGDVIVLAGEMGAGKTAFAQGFAAGLGVDEPVTSPTFTLVHTYDSGDVVLHHADLYRLDRFGEVDDLGLDELSRDAIVLVEWGDMVGEVLGDRLEVFLASDDVREPDHRAIDIRAEGRGWVARRERLETALQPWVVG